MTFFTNESQDNKNTVVQTLWVLVCLVIVINYLWKKRDPLGPPGTNGVPFLGVLMSLRSHPERVLAKWKQKYGPIYTTKFGFTDVVVIGSTEVAHEAYIKNDCFDGRPTSIPAFDDKGIVMNNNLDIHKELRRFGFSVFRSLGVSNSKFELKVLAVSQQVCVDFNRILSSDKQPSSVNVDELISKITFNVFSDVMFGENIIENNKSFCKIMQALQEQDSSAQLAGMIMLMPVLRYLPVFSRVWKDGIDFRENFAKESNHEVNKHVKDRDAKSPRDFIDYFLNEIDKVSIKSDDDSLRKDYDANAGSVKQSAFNKKQLVATIRDLFLGGDHTIRSSLLWTFLYLSKYPEVQVKMQEEIDRVLGSNHVRMAHRSKLPYTQAILHEIERLRPPIPLSIPHSVTKETFLQGYRIPKGAIVLTNYWAMNHDDKIWPEPDKFKPERHLDSNGNFDKNANNPNFGIGARSCLGKHLAIMEVFITTVTLFQHFNFRLPEGSNPDMKGESKISLRPHDFDVIISRR